MNEHDHYTEFRSDRLQHFLLHSLRLVLYCMAKINLNWGSWFNPTLFWEAPIHFSVMSMIYDVDDLVWWHCADLDPRHPWFLADDTRSHHSYLDCPYNDRALSFNHWINPENLCTPYRVVDGAKKYNRNRQRILAPFRKNPADVPKAGVVFLSPYSPDFDPVEEYSTVRCETSFCLNSIWFLNWPILNGISTVTVSHILVVNSMLSTWHVRSI